MKPFWSSLISLIFLTLLMGISLSCSQVKFDSKKNTFATCTGAECEALYTYSWHQGGFGNCSVSCGGGIETQIVTCQRNDGVNVESGLCNNAGTKPPTDRSCNLQACPPGTTYSWFIGNWNICPVSCGGGTQTRTVTCKDNLGQDMSDSYCSSTKPSSSQPCNQTSCGPSYGWQLQVGQCTATCGGGWSVYKCVRSTDGQVMTDESLCTDPKPQVACNTHACGPTYTYSWYTGGWSVCSKSCGGGTRTRDVLCKRNDGDNMADVYCQGQSQPVSQETCNTQACPVTGRNVTTTMTLPMPAVDIVMIVDDSASMAADNQKLASRMGGFLSDLDNARLDYRVCITTTDVRPSKVMGGPQPWGIYGSPIKWGPDNSSGNFVMLKSTSNKDTLFQQTVNYIGSGYSNDEQGIHAMRLFLDNYPNSGCLRDKSTLAVILISDEDERSVGGIRDRSHAQYQPLQAVNMPDNLIARVAAKYNTANYVKPFIWNSIVVKDAACEATQDAQGTPSFPGSMYIDLSNKTGGHVESICESDYSQHLRYVRDRVVQTMPYVTLECSNPTNLDITISPSFSTSITRTDNKVSFNPALPEGTTVTAKYFCPN